MGMAKYTFAFCRFTMSNPPGWKEPYGGRPAARDCARALDGIRRKAHTNTARNNEV
jgi:hypothetical protein